MAARWRIALSFAVAISMLAVNVVLLLRGVPVLARFAAESAIGVGYALALVAWRARNAGR